MDLFFHTGVRNRVKRQLPSTVSSGTPRWFECVKLSFGTSCSLATCLSVSDGFASQLFAPHDECGSSIQTTCKAPRTSQNMGPNRRWYCSRHCQRHSWHVRPLRCRATVFVSNLAEQLYRPRRPCRVAVQCWFGTSLQFGYDGALSWYELYDKVGEHAKEWSCLQERYVQLPIAIECR